MIEYLPESLIHPQRIYGKLQPNKCYLTKHTNEQLKFLHYHTTLEKEVVLEDQNGKKKWFYPSSLKEIINPKLHLIHKGIYTSSKQTIVYYETKTNVFTEFGLNEERIIDVDINDFNDLTLIGKKDTYPQCILDLQNPKFKKVDYKEFQETIRKTPHQELIKFPNQIKINELKVNEIYLIYPDIKGHIDYFENKNNPIKAKFLYLEENFPLFQTENNELKHVHIKHVRKVMNKPSLFIHGCTYQYNDKLIKFYSTPNGFQFTEVNYNLNENPINVDLNNMKNLRLIDTSIPQIVQIPNCVLQYYTSKPAITTETINYTLEPHITKKPTPENNELKPNIKNVGIATTVFLTLTYFINKLLGN